MTQQSCSNSDDFKPRRRDTGEQTIRHIEALARKGLKDFSVLQEDYEDVLQEAIWVIYQRLCYHEFHHDIPLDHYINKAIYLRKMDYRRKKLKRAAQLTNYINECAANYEGMIQRKSESLLSQIEADTILECIEKHIDVLSTFEIQVLNYLIEEWAPNEIAQHLSVNSKKVYNAIFRLRKKLKTILQLEKVFDN